MLNKPKSFRDKNKIKKKNNLVKFSLNFRFQLDYE